MISLKELNPKNAPVTPEQEHNSAVLLDRLNQVRIKRGITMLVTSGFRTLEDHKRIYMDIARRTGNSNVRIPMGSAHLKFAAADILDQDGSLMKWCRDNIPFLEQVGLWIEDDSSVPRVHFQIYPPASGNRFFKP